MVHLVYCDDKEKVLEKIINGSKTMVIRGATGRKIPHSRVFEGETLYFMKKGTAQISVKATVKVSKIRLGRKEPQKIKSPLLSVLNCDTLPLLLCATIIICCN